MPRGEQMARQWKILQHLLIYRQGVTIQELVTRLGCHRRTVYRDLDALQGAGFPLYAERRDNRQRWRLVETYAAQLPIPFDLGELTALYFSRNLLKALQGSIFSDALDSLFSKIKTTLPPELRAYLDAMAGQIKIGTPPGRRLKDVSPLLAQLNKAIGDHRRILMDYQALNPMAKGRRKVDPLAIWVFSGTFYLIAFCHQRDDIRIFALDRISELKLTSEGFQVPLDFNVDEYMQGSFGVFRGEPRDVRIWFAPDLAPYIVDTQWHPSQQVHTRADGSVVLSLQVAVNAELTSWVLSWGAQARVLQPSELREALKVQGAALLALYEGESSSNGKLQDC